MARRLFFLSICLSAVVAWLATTSPTVGAIFAPSRWSKSAGVSFATRAVVMIEDSRIEVPNDKAETLGPELSRLISGAATRRDCDAILERLGRIDLVDDTGRVLGTSPFPSGAAEVEKMRQKLTVRAGVPVKQAGGLRIGPATLRVGLDDRLLRSIRAREGDFRAAFAATISTHRFSAPRL